MWFRVKYTSEEVQDNGKTIHFLDYYLLDADNFAEAGYKVMELHNNTGEVEDVCLMKAYKPAVNEYTDGNKLFIVKVAQDFTEENGKTKTIKYPMPVFANSNDELQIIMKDFIAQGFDDMRLVTVSETTWKYIDNIK